jgi:hypothetical protein
MAWQEILVIGVPERSVVEHCSMTPGSRVGLQLEDDLLPPHTVEVSGMWFIELSLESFEATSDTSQIDGVDEPMTSTCLTGVIADTDIQVRLIFFGETLDHFMINQ